MTSVGLTSEYIRPHTHADYSANGMRNCVWTRIDTDEGVHGWGEAYCGCYATEVTLAAIKRLARSIVGRDPRKPDTVLSEMRFRNRYWAMRGIGAQCTSAIEAALWDIAGKVAGQPLWRLLGDGAPRPVLLYASAGESHLSPDEVFNEVRECTALGFHAYKIRCGGRRDACEPDLETDRRRVEAARAALGESGKLFVDIAVPQKTSQWDIARVEAFSRALSDLDVGFLEEPAMTYDVIGYRRIRELGLIPPAGGESFSCPEEFTPFLEAGAYGVAQPDAAVCGGPASCTKVIQQAARRSVPVAIHAWSAGVGLAQNIHAACSCEGVTVMEWPMSHHPLAELPLRNMWDFRDGMLHPPEAPGLGVSIDDQLLSAYPLQQDEERDF